MNDWSKNRETPIYMQALRCSKKERGRENMCICDINARKRAPYAGMRVYETTRKKIKSIIFQNQDANMTLEMECTEKKVKTPPNDPTQMLKKISFFGKY